MSYGEICNDKNGEFTCRMYANHEGNHTVYDRKGSVVRTWPKSLSGYRSGDLIRVEYAGSHPGVTRCDSVTVERVEGDVIVSTNGYRYHKNTVVSAPQETTVSTPVESPRSESLPTLKDLLRKHCRLSQALRGDVVQVVPDIASRAMKLDRLEAEILERFSDASGSVVPVPRQELQEWRARFVALDATIRGESDETLDVIDAIDRWLGGEQNV